MKKILSVALTVLLISGCSKGDTAAIETFTPVEVLSVQKDNISKTLTYQGRIKPYNMIQILNKYQGEVKQSFFDVGDKVNENDVLYTLDRESLENQLKQLESQLRSSNSTVVNAKTNLNLIKGGQKTNQLTQLETGLESTKRQLEGANVSLESAKKGEELASKNLLNAKALYDAGAMGKIEYDQIESSYKQAQSQLEQAQINVDVTSNQLNQQQQSYEITKNEILVANEIQAEQSLIQATAQKDALQTQLKDLRKNLEDLNVKSPISGVVGTKAVVEGEMLGNQIAYTVMDIDKVLVDVGVTESLINNIKKGDNVTVLIKAISNTPFEGVVKDVQITSDQTNMYPVTVELSNPTYEIKPGMFSEVTFETEKAENVIVLPRESVLEKDGFYVYKIENNIAKKTNVTLGVDSGKEVEITTGLNIGDNVVINGQHYIVDTEKVKVLVTEEE